MRLVSIGGLLLAEIWTVIRLVSEPLVNLIAFVIL
jgi:hypothetical protein